MPTLVKVAEVGAIAPGTSKKVDAGGHEIALFNAEGMYYAIGNTCTHRGGPLSEGSVQGTTVTCPWHGAQFDLQSGNVTGPPAQRNVPSYNVVVDGSDIKIEIP